MVRESWILSSWAESGPVDWETTAMCWSPLYCHIWEVPRGMYIITFFMADLWVLNIAMLI
jgi:hypothetical protein